MNSAVDVKPTDGSRDALNVAIAFTVPSMTPPRPSSVSGTLRFAPFNRVVRSVAFLAVAQWQTLARLVPLRVLGHTAH
jgi:hypothetical protein